MENREEQQARHDHNQRNGHAVRAVGMFPSRLYHAIPPRPQTAGQPLPIHEKKIARPALNFGDRIAMLRLQQSDPLIYQRLSTIIVIENEGGVVRHALAVIHNAAADLIGE